MQMEFKFILMMFCICGQLFVFNSLSIEAVTNCDSVLVDQKSVLFLKPAEFNN